MNAGSSQLFIDLGYRQCSCAGESICGDAVIYRQLEDGRLVYVLSDGLGHGVKANILSSMTASMAARFSAHNPADIAHSAQIIMDALPVCQARKISYSTFTIVTATVSDGRTDVRIVEMGNPDCILLRHGEEQFLESKVVTAPRHPDRAMKVYDFVAEPGDRLITMSDGITQAGMGRRGTPTGWSREECRQFVCEVIRENPEISSYELAGLVITEAVSREDNFSPEDDMTVGVIQFRYPRRLMLFTGPPFDRARDRECAAALRDYPGTRVICGGTTAEIVAREWKKELMPDFSSVGGKLPPMSKLKGADLVTEGIYTLPVTAQYLEQHNSAGKKDPAARLAEMMLDHDIIDFLVGTRINEAHQDPNLPIELELRRNIVKRIAGVLQQKYLKEVTIKFV